MTCVVITIVVVCVDDCDESLFLFSLHSHPLPLFFVGTRGVKLIRETDFFHINPSLLIWKLNMSTIVFSPYVKYVPQVLLSTGPGTCMTVSGHFSAHLIFCLKFQQRTTTLSRNESH